MRRLPVQNPPNPWARTDIAYDAGETPNAPLSVFFDRTKSILSKNDSPDIFFRYSVNPYRGCTHACAYCYARPTHEYLSFGSGTDFDRKILVKEDAPQLLDEALSKRSMQGQVVVFSGVTDCYQPLEAEYQLTRACLLVCEKHRNPVSVITKSALVLRDLDVFERLKASSNVHITMSIPFWDEDVARAIEPYAPTPSRRLRTLKELAESGVSVGINVAPIIPGLNDADVGKLLEAAKGSGASHAGYVLLRLPGSVKAVFVERIREALPLRAEKILRRVRETRGGELYQSKFGERQSGTGVYANQIHALFTQMAARHGLLQSQTSPALASAQPKAEERPRKPKKAPPAPEGQLALFE